MKKVKKGLKTKNPSNIEKNNKKTVAKKTILSAKTAVTGKAKNSKNASEKVIPEKLTEKKISDKAVHAKTGKTFQEWFLILDEVAAENVNHKEKAKFLFKKFPEIGPWWSQMIVVNYEQERGLRKKYEKTDGFAISASKVINVPVKNLFAAWIDDKIRGAWLTETIYIHKEIPQKCVRFDWYNGTPIEVNFYDKGKKAQVVVQHSKLPNAEEAEKMKIFWSEALERLLKTIKVTFGIE